MSSFSYQLKKEVALSLPTSHDEAISELSAIIKTSGEINLGKTNNKIICKTEIEEVTNKINYILNMLYGKKAKVVTVADNMFNKKQRYQLEFPSDITNQILQDAEIINYENNYMSFVNGISKYIVQEENLAKSYIKGVFESVFTCNISLGEEATSKNTGYHAEFVFNSEVLAKDFSLLLADFEIISKTVERKNFYVVYIKDCEMISDLFSLVGASKGVFALQNENILRSIRNNANRQTNCISANIAKTVEASVRETEAIKIIQQTIGLEKLDDNLLKVANLRLANPEESLDNLVKLSTEKISKSGLYHRLKKLEKIAKELKQ